MAEQRKAAAEHRARECQVTLAEMEEEMASLAEAREDEQQQLDLRWPLAGHRACRRSPRRTMPLTIDCCPSIRHLAR